MRLIDFLIEAKREAKKSTCRRRKCGAVIVKDNIIIGRGHNSPAGEKESQRRCHCEKSEYHEKVTDKTCCVHAEQRAILDAIDNYGLKELQGAELIFSDGGFSGTPYCTICSKMILDVEIKTVTLEERNGLHRYDPEEYNRLSYDYK